jgi:hypothetical protein
MPDMWTLTPAVQYEDHDIWVDAEGHYHYFEGLTTDLWSVPTGWRPSMLVLRTGRAYTLCKREPFRMEDDYAVLFYRDAGGIARVTDITDITSVAREIEYRIGVRFDATLWIEEE